MAVIGLMACSTSSNDTLQMDANTSMDAMDSSLDSQITETSDSAPNVMDARPTDDSMSTFDSGRPSDAAQSADTAVANDAQPARDTTVTAPDAGTHDMQANEGDMGINDDSGACDMAEERCNGQDDDCDGRVDEQVLAVGQRCDHNALGVCASGRFVCDRGELICEPTMEATDERCDGLDNDCDGETDEMFPNAGGACNTGQSGVCEAGIRTCLNGELSCVSIEQGSAELCNRTDDDCDGRIDENAAGAGDECDPGWAIPNCRRIARNRCEDGVLRCDEGPRPPDLCNGVDDDCDGRTGEDAQGMMCDTGALGQCAVGSQICQDADIECAPAFESTCEVDNQLDDDCDGLIDEAPEAFCAPPEQQLTRFCLSDNNQYIALDMTVDRLGEIYVSRASLVQGNLNFTHVRRDGTHDNTRVQSRVSTFPNLPIQDTDLIVEDGTAHICFRNARSRRFQYGFQNPDGSWNLENMPTEGDGGIECAIGLIRGRPVIAYRQNGELMFAERQADATWSTSVVDSVANSTVGLELDMQIHNGVPYVVHRDTNSLSFRLTYRRDGNWRTMAGPIGRGLAGGGFGFRPSLMVTDDQIIVVHGDVPAEIDIGSDGSLYVSSTGPISMTSSGPKTWMQMDMEVDRLSCRITTDSSPLGAIDSAARSASGRMV